MVLSAAVGPYFTVDPIALNPIQRLKPPSAEVWFGSDFLGRHAFARVIACARVSHVVGLAVALAAVAIGLALVSAAGAIRARAARITRMPHTARAAGRDAVRQVG